MKLKKDKKINNNPLISIIMNCHNGEKYLSTSLQSIIKQTYKNWELIFYDNKSSDNSKKIVKNLKDNRIKLFSSSKFITLYKARNLAVQKCKGKFITFLDTDDWWHKEKLKRQIEFFKKFKKTKILYSKFYIFDQETKKKKINTERIYSGQITKNLMKNYNIGILTTMVERNIFTKFRFSQKYNIIGDFDFFTRLSLEYPFNKIDKPLAYFRLHKKNYSRLNINRYIDELNYWLKFNKKLFKKKGVTLLHPWITLVKLKIKKIINYY